MIIHIDSSTAEIVDDILTRASEVSAPLRVSNRSLRDCLSLETARRRKLIANIDSPDFSFERHRFDARLNLAWAELVGPNHPKLKLVLAPL